MTVAKLNREVVLKKGRGSIPSDAFDGFYLKEIELQCEFAIRAYGEIVERIQRGLRDDGVLAFCHMFLVFAGNVSKLLFASPKARPQTRERAKRLRELAGIADNSPIALRGPRNYMEHFDERMDEYLLRSRPQGIIAHRLVFEEHPEELELDDGRKLRAHFLQCFNVTTMEFGFFDQKLALAPLCEELQSLQSKVQQIHQELVMDGETYNPSPTADR